MQVWDLARSIEKLQCHVDVDQADARDGMQLLGG